MSSYRVVLVISYLFFVPQYPPPLQCFRLVGMLLYFPLHVDYCFHVQHFSCYIPFSCCSYQGCLGVPRFCWPFPLNYITLILVAQFLSSYFYASICFIWYNLQLSYYFSWIHFVFVLGNILSVYLVRQCVYKAISLSPGIFSTTIVLFLLHIHRCKHFSFDLYLSFLSSALLNFVADSIFEKTRIIFIVYCLVGCSIRNTGAWLLDFTYFWSPECLRVLLVY